MWISYFYIATLVLNYCLLIKLFFKIIKHREYFVVFINGYYTAIVIITAICLMGFLILSEYFFDFLIGKFVYIRLYVMLENIPLFIMADKIVNCGVKCIFKHGRLGGREC